MLPVRALTKKFFKNTDTEKDIPNNSKSKFKKINILSNDISVSSKTSDSLSKSSAPTNNEKNMIMLHKPISKMRTFLRSKKADSRDIR